MPKSTWKCVSTWSVNRTFTMAIL